MNRISLIASLLIVGLSLQGQTIITDRPDQTESSSTIEKGSLQIESGVLLGFTEEVESEQRQLLAPTTLFRYGLIDAIELRLLSQFESVKDQTKGFTSNGISDLEIGTKIQFLRNEDVNIEIAFLSHLIMRTGSKNLSNDAYGTINKLSISHELTDNIGLGYNVGYDYFGFGNGNLTYSVALGVGVTDKAAVYIEPYGVLEEFEDYLSSFDAGFTYLVKENLQVDFSFGTGLNYKMNYLSLGFSWHLREPKS